MTSDRDNEHDFETIRPAEVNLASTAGEPPEDASAAWFQRPGTWLLVALLLALLGLLFWLPGQLRPDTESIAAGDRDRSDSEQQVEPVDPDIAPVEEDELEVSAPFHERQLARAREQVEDLISELLDRQDALERRNVELWGESAFALALDLARQGDDAFVAREYEQARATYQEAVDRLGVLQELAPKVLAGALAAGNKALADEQPERALEQFQLAVAIDGDAEAARKGLRRAARLPEVLTALERATELLEGGDLEGASEAVAEALELDPETERAQRLQDQVATAQRDARYRDALSRGYRALSEQQFDSAEQAFGDALRLRPESADAGEGLVLVEQAVTAARIEAISEEAATLMAAEAWDAAAERYQTALDLDATLSFARQGLALARSRSSLLGRIEDTLADPDRLSETPQLDAARELLLAARSQAPLPPILGRRTDELSRLLEVAARPVPVVMRSDGETDVVILRVARLGSFRETTLELRPGRYVATGSRNGFRDVRKEFRVAPDNNDPVTIMTRERI